MVAKINVERISSAIEALMWGTYLNVTLEGQIMRWLTVTKVALGGVGPSMLSPPPPKSKPSQKSVTASRMCRVHRSAG